MISGDPLRLWSIHPSLLDRAGLVALWREALLAQQVLLGRTKAYRFHPQLERFWRLARPGAAISTYLLGVYEEANRRGYRFDVSKIIKKPQEISIAVPRGQLLFELQHLKRKLKLRDPARLGRLPNWRSIPAHPMFRVVPGPIAAWERRARSNR